MKMAIIIAGYVCAAMSMIAVSVTIFTLGFLWFGDFMAWLAAKQQMVNFGFLYIVPVIVVALVGSLGTYFLWLAVAMGRNGFAGNKQLA